MATEEELLRALDMLTLGEQAPVRETLRAEALRVREAAVAWSSEDGIQGFGIGPKITDSEQLDEVVVKVYVERKKPKAQLDAPVPKTLRIAGVEGTIATDVQEIGKVELESNTGRVRPAIPGFGVGLVRTGSAPRDVGTFGCLVRKVGDDALYILSNSHVLADEGLAAPGVQVVQPGALDDGAAPGDVLAVLSDFVPFQFTPAGFPNLVDAAIAKVKNARQVTSQIRLIGTPVGVSRTLRRGMRVQKTGRTTDYTQGIIQDVNYRTALDYRRPEGGTGRVGFQDQVLCTRFTAGGDSGSAVLNMQKRVVGLHFAGSPSSSIFHKIANVLTLLKIEVVTDKI